MQHNIFKFWLFKNLVLSWTLICASNLWAVEKIVHIRQAWVRHAPANATVLAAYCVLENTTGQSIVLKSLHSPLFDSIEIHRTQHSSSFTRMKRIETLEILSKQKIALAPNGLHLMLIGPKQKLALQAKVPIRFIFTDHEQVVEFIVQRE